ncbi:MAG: hypothetical protein Q8M92_08155, partial [Candidatus Subteraquimicrobiales bacterium]|nr:hypothetical protein [Candidatus Subteraquimicrobiales bacterium]
GTTSPGSRFVVVGGSSTFRGLDSQPHSLAVGSATGDFKVVVSTAGNVGIGTTNPGAKLEVVGTVKMLGAWTTASTNTVYQAASDGFVIIHVIDETSSIVTDSANPPTVVRAWAAALVSGDRRGSATVPVRKGDYWKIVRNTGTGGTDVFWIPLGQ